MYLEPLRRFRDLWTTVAVWCAVFPERVMKNDEIADVGWIIGEWIYARTRN